MELALYLSLLRHLIRLNAGVEARFKVSSNEFRVLWRVFTYRHGDAWGKWNSFSVSLWHTIKWKGWLHWDTEKKGWTQQNNKYAHLSSSILILLTILQLGLVGLKKVTLIKLFKIVDLINSVLTLTACLACFISEFESCLVARHTTKRSNMPP